MGRQMTPSLRGAGQLGGQVEITDFSQHLYPETNQERTRQGRHTFHSASSRWVPVAPNCRLEFRLTSKKSKKQVQILIINKYLFNKYL
jgi:hypothetical protein